MRACFTRQRETRHLNAFVTVEAEEAAMQQARQADAQRARGEPAPLLAGMPLAVKSNLCMQGTLTTAASRMLVDFVAPYDATAVSRLRAAGALLLGNTNMDEFGMGSAGLYSVHGPTQHPSTAVRCVARGMRPAQLTHALAHASPTPALTFWCLAGAAVAVQWRWPRGPALVRWVQTRAAPSAWWVAGVLARMRAPPDARRARSRRRTAAWLA